MKGDGPFHHTFRNGFESRRDFHRVRDSIFIHRAGYNVVDARKFEKALQHIIGPPFIRARNITARATHLISRHQVQLQALREIDAKHFLDSSAHPCFFTIPNGEGKNSQPELPNKQFAGFRDCGGTQDRFQHFDVFHHIPESIFRIFGSAFLKKWIEQFGEARIVFGNFRKRIVNQLLDCCYRMVSFKRQLSCQEMKDQHGERIDIGAMIDGFSLSLFGRHIFGGPEDCPFAGWSSGSNHLRHSKIGEINPVAFVD